MLKIDKNSRRLTQLSTASFSEADYDERSGMQELILRNPEVFFQECKENLFVIREEVEPSAHVLDRIDIWRLMTRRVSSSLN